jgi:hypothetical protein
LVSGLTRTASTPSVLLACLSSDVGYTEGIRALSVADMLRLFTCLHSHMTTMHDALTARFDDADEIKDVANYGCAGGVNGFIYYSETSKFFDEYEDEILDYLMDMAGITYQDLVPNADSIQSLKCSAVWFAVEDYCQMALNVLENEAALAA